MRRLYSHGIILTIALTCCLSSSAVLSQKKWTGSAGDGLWTSASNWSGSSLPTSTDDVILDNTNVSGSYTVTLPGNASVQTMRSLQVGYSGNANMIKLLIDNTAGGIASVLTLNGGGATALYIQDNGILENISSYASTSQTIRLVNATDVFKISGSGTYIHNTNSNIPRRSSGTTASNYDLAGTSVFELRTATFDATPVYGHLTYNISGTNSAAKNLSINGNLSVLQGTLGVAASTSNTFTIAGNILISNGAILRGSGSTGTSAIIVTGNITGGGTLQGSSNGSGTTNITVGGDITSQVNFGTGINSLTFSGGAASVNFTPSNASTPTIQNITMGDGTNAKSVTLGSNISIASSKSLSISNAAVLICGTNKINGSGSVTVNNGGTLKCGSTNISGAVNDNIAVTGGLTLNAGSTVELNGSAAQTLGARTFSNLRINNSNGVTSSGDITISDMLTLSAGNLSISSNTLTLNGGVVVIAGALDGTSSSNLALGGTSAQAISFATSSSLNNLTLNKSNGTATLGSALNVYGAITWSNVNGILDLNGKNLVLKSTSSGTARVGIVPSLKMLNASNVTVERYIPAKRSWRLLTAPLTGSTNNTVFYNWQNNGANGNGFDIWGPGGTGSAGNGLSAGASASLRKYTSLGWANITDTKTETLFGASENNSFAVFATGPYGGGNIASGATATTAKATGALRTGNITYSNLTFGRHSLVGNPFASPVDIHAVMTGSTNFDPFVWLWDPAIGSVGGYVTYDVVADTYTTSTSYPADVQSGQAFFVKANNATNTFTISENHKTSNTTNNIYRGNSNAAVFKTALYKLNTGNTVLADAVMNVFSIGENAAVDSHDAIKLINSGENISIRKNGINLSVEHRPLVTGNDTIPLQLTGTIPSTYSFSFSAVNMIGITAYLQDAFLNTSTPIGLTGTPVQIDFTVTPDPFSSGNRFSIIFRPAALSIIKEIEGIRLYPNPAKDKVTIEMNNVPPGDHILLLINCIGQVVFQKKIRSYGGTSIETFMFNKPIMPGIYLWRFTGKDVDLHQQIIIYNP